MSGKTFLILLAVFVIWLLEFAPVPTTTEHYAIRKADGSNAPITKDEAIRLDAAAYELTHQEGNQNVETK